MSKIKKTVVGVLLLSAIALVAVRGAEFSEGVYEGLVFCAEVLVPSLFPFMVLSSFITRIFSFSGQGRLAGVLCRYVFRLPSPYLGALLLGLIGGYPVGANVINNLRKRDLLSESEAKRAAYVTVAAGPGFLVTFVGTKLYGCAELGYVIMAAQIISVIALGIVSGRFTDKVNFSGNTKISESVPASQAFVESVSDASGGMVGICGTVAVFSAINHIILFYIGKELGKYFCMFLEVTNACKILSDEKNVLFTAFAVGFGGLSVHFQIFGALSNVPLNRGVFILYRFVQGIITAALTYIFINVFGISLPIFSTVNFTPSPALGTTAVGSVLLIISGICFINYLGGKYVRNSRID